MRVVWETHPLTAREIADRLEPHKGWSERTVKTLIARLVKKDALGYRQDGKRYAYSPAVSRERCVAAASDSFLERVFGGSASPLLAYFLRGKKLSPSEIAELRALLEEQGGEQ